jgi:hypothetical protein
LDFGSIEDHLIDIFGQSCSEGEMRIKMENLTSMIDLAKDMQKEDSHAAAGNS